MPDLSIHLTMLLKSLNLPDVQLKIDLTKMIHYPAFTNNVNVDIKMMRNFLKLPTLSITSYHIHSL